MKNFLDYPRWNPNVNKLLKHSITGFFKDEMNTVSKLEVSLYGTLVVKFLYLQEVKRYQKT
jgi:hypothetical protein